MDGARQSEACIFATFRFSFGSGNTSSNVFDRGVAVMNTMISMNVWDSVKHTLGERTAFTNKKLDHDVAILNIHSWMTRLNTDFAHSLPANMLALIAVEGVKFLVPATNDPDSICVTSNRNRKVPWLFENHKTSLLEMISTDMGSAIAYTPSGVKKAERVFKKARKDTEVPEHTMAINKNKLWLDDVHQNFKDLFEKARPLAVPRADAMDTLQKLCYSLALEFCFCGRVNLCERSYTKWSDLRPALRVFACSRVAKLTHKSTGEDDSGENGDDLDFAAELLRSIDEPADVGDELDEDILENLINDRAEDLQAYISENASGWPIRMHAVYTKTVRAAYMKYAGKAPADIEMEELVLTVCSTLGEALGVCSEIAVACATSIITDAFLPKPLVKFFPDISAATAFVESRSNYLIDSLLYLCNQLSLHPFGPDFQFVDFLPFLKEVGVRIFVFKFDTMAGMDVASTWQSAWVSLLKSFNAPELKPSLKDALAVMIPAASKSGASSSVDPPSATASTGGQRAGASANIATGTTTEATAPTAAPTAFSTLYDVMNFAVEDAKCVIPEGLGHVPLWELQDSARLTAPLVDMVCNFLEGVLLAKVCGPENDQSLKAVEVDLLKQNGGIFLKNDADVKDNFASIQLAFGGVCNTERTRCCLHCRQLHVLPEREPILLGNL
jgi:hypothetical protein